MPKQSVIAELGRSYVDLYSLFTETIDKIDQEPDREQIDMIISTVHQALTAPECISLINYLNEKYNT